MPPSPHPQDTKALLALAQGLQGKPENWTHETPPDTWPYVFWQEREGEKRVVRLEIAGVSFKGTLGEALGDLAALEHLSITSDNVRGPLPQSLGRLHKLEELIIHSEGFDQAMPDVFAGLHSLERIDFSYSPLTSLPASFARLAALQVLDLSRTAIRNLPEDLSGMPALRVLKLKECGLKTVPEGLFTLSALQELNLDNNQLETLPEAIARLKNLDTLSLDDNLLSELPLTFGELEHLRMLSLSGNRLTNLPPSMAALQNLSLLLVSNNRLQALPPWIGQLRKLSWFMANNNSMQGSIPPALWTLPELRSLSLSRNQLSGPLDSAVCAMSNLRELHIEHNRLSGELPECLSTMGLRELGYEGNLFAVSPAMEAKQQALAFDLLHPFLRYKQQPPANTGTTAGARLKLPFTSSPIGLDARSLNAENQRLALWQDTQQLSISLDVSPQRADKTMPAIEKLLAERLQALEKQGKADFLAEAVEQFYDWCVSEFDEHSRKSIGRDLPDKEHFHEILWLTAVDIQIEAAEDGSLQDNINLSFDTYEALFGGHTIFVRMERGTVVEISM